MADSAKDKSDGSKNEKDGEVKEEVKKDAIKEEVPKDEEKPEVKKEVEEMETEAKGSPSKSAQDKGEGSSVTKKEEEEPMDIGEAKTEPISGSAADSDKVVDDTESPFCYCGKERDLTVLELQCGFCFRYYHAKCIKHYLGKGVAFMTNYQFFCKRCNPNGMESFSKKQATFPNMCQTALANLQKDNQGRTFFSKDKEIIPYIDKNWEHLTTVPRRIKQTWHTTITKTLAKETELFMMRDDTEKDQHFSLLTTDLSKIGPNYENLFKTTGAFFKSDLFNKFQNSNSDGKTRGAKRKAPESQSSAIFRQKRGEVSSFSRTAPHGYPLEHPFNKDGYRYILAEPDPHAPNRQEFDESSEFAGKPIPGYLYRTWLGRKVLLALHDRAPQLKLTDDCLTVTGEKGYSMIRATHGVSHGDWYYEAVVTEMPEGTCTRIGWAQSLGNLQAPCGYDRFSYSWRSKKGTRFHHSRGMHYSSEYKVGDVLGFYISLPKPEDPGKLLPTSAKDKPLVKFKSHLYYEDKDFVTDAEKALKPLRGSKICMYKNGKCSGVAWTDINEGTYYPTVSIYKCATVTVNFGPKFKRQPRDLDSYRPLSDAVAESVVQHTLGDILYHVEHEGQLPEF